MLGLQGLSIQNSTQGKHRHERLVHQLEVIFSSIFRIHMLHDQRSITKDLILTSEQYGAGNRDGVGCSSEVIRKISSELD